MVYLGIAYIIALLSVMALGFAVSAYQAAQDTH